MMRNCSLNTVLGNRKSNTLIMSKFDCSSDDEDSDEEDDCVIDNID